MAAILLVGTLASCSSTKAKAPSTTPTTAAVPGATPLVTAGPAAPKGSPVDAVTALLTAEQANDHVASFGLIDQAGRAAYATAPDWARRRAELPPITAFKIESTKGDDVTALVNHHPGIDPFIGLQFAAEHQVWHAVKAGGGWLVDPDPKTTPVVPPDGGARTAALTWATALQACDTAGAAKVQAVTNLLGVSAGPGALCHAAGTVTAAAPAAADQGPQTADLVAQFTVDVLGYVRKVHIGGIPAPFDAYLVPVGDAWQVVAVAG
ncbi:MAG: hypothetical protein NVSMB12_05680 [Acidimicrobiales bacterium]